MRADFDSYLLQELQSNGALTADDRTVVVRRNEDGTSLLFKPSACSLPRVHTIITQNHATCTKYAHLHDNHLEDPNCSRNHRASRLHSIHATLMSVSSPEPKHAGATGCLLNSNPSCCGPLPGPVTVAWRDEVTPGVFAAVACRERRSNTCEDAVIRRWLSAPVHLTSVRSDSIHLTLRCAAWHDHVCRNAADASCQCQSTSMIARAATCRSNRPRYGGARLGKPHQLRHMYHTANPG